MSTMKPKKEEASSSIFEGIAGSATGRIQFSGTEMMTPGEWADVADNPRQRDTAVHAKRAKHLHVLHPSHVKVNMAVLPDGERFKLDGHTRSFLWRRGEVEQPARLYVDVWRCSSISDVKELYSTFDSKGAVEQTADQMAGAFKELQLEFQSDLLRSKQFTAAMRYAHEMLFGSQASRAISIYNLVRYWVPELKLLDTCEPTRARFNTGVTTAALIIFRRRGPDAIDFWAAFAANAGVKDGFYQDAVQALHERIERRRRGDGLNNGRKHAQEIAAIGISAFERYQAGEMYNLKASGIKATKQTAFRRYLTATKATTRRW